MLTLALIRHLALLRPWAVAGWRGERGEGKEVLEVLAAERLGTRLRQRGGVPAQGVG